MLISALKNSRTKINWSIRLQPRVIFDTFSTSDNLYRLLRNESTKKFVFEAITQREIKADITVCDVLRYQYAYKTQGVWQILKIINSTEIHGVTFMKTADLIYTEV
jgi:hypothetical protein